MDNNLIIVSLNDEGRQISEKVASELGLYFIDCKRYLDEQLAKSGLLFEDFNIENLQAQEKQTITQLLKTGKLLIYCNFDIFKFNYDLFNGIKIYLKFGKNSINNTLSKIVYNQRDKFLTKTCDVINLSDEINKISKILKFLEGKL